MAETQISPLNVGVSPDVKQTKGVQEYLMDNTTPQGLDHQTGLQLAEFEVCISVWVTCWKAWTHRIGILRKCFSTCHCCSSVSSQQSFYTHTQKVASLKPTTEKQTTNDLIRAAECPSSYYCRRGNNGIDDWCIDLYANKGFPLLHTAVCFVTWCTH